MRRVPPLAAPCTGRLPLSHSRGAETLGPSQHLFRGQADPESSALRRGADLPALELEIMQDPAEDVC